MDGLDRLTFGRFLAHATRVHARAYEGGTVEEECGLLVLGLQVGRNPGRWSVLCDVDCVRPLADCCRARHAYTVQIHTLGVHAWPIGLLWPIVVRSNQHRKENLVVHLSPNFTPWEKPQPQNRLASLPSSLSPRATAAGCCPARCPPTTSTAPGSGSPEHSSSSTPAAKSSGSRVIFHYGGSSTQVSRTPDLPRARPSSTDLARKNHLCSFDVILFRLLVIPFAGLDSLFG